jgi:xanthine/uracil/vitamin C permease (AzgA family)
MVSTKSGLRGLTYAQNLCCGASRVRVSSVLRYQSHSASKSLICIASLNCFFYGHFKKTLDLQGLWVIAAKLSTKLSTENLEISKAPLNQALRAFFASAFGKSLTSAYVTSACRP